MDYLEYAKEIVDNREGVIAAYGYGSAFSHQSGYSAKTKKSLDMIFVVDNLKKWNENNFKLHPRDYTKYTKAIFKCAPKAFLTNNTSVIYNVINDRYDKDFKYGLIEKERLLDDLKTWKHFYVCGRLQKPIYILKSNSEIDQAINLNRKYALLVSLLILNREVVKVSELLEQICHLSYDGDVRTLFAENPNKVKNIVNGSYDELVNMYCNNEFVDKKGQFVFVNLDRVYDELNNLPSDLMKKYDIHSKRYDDYLKKELNHKNLKESMAHPVKQFLVSGFSTCRKYMKEKVKKKNLK